MARQRDWQRVGSGTHKAGWMGLMSTPTTWKRSILRARRRHRLSGDVRRSRGARQLEMVSRLLCSDSAFWAYQSPQSRFQCRSRHQGRASGACPCLRGRWTADYPASGCTGYVEGLRTIVRLVLTTSGEDDVVPRRSLSLCDTLVVSKKRGTYGVHVTKLGTSSFGNQYAGRY